MLSRLLFEKFPRTRFCIVPCRIYHLFNQPCYCWVSILQPPWKQLLEYKKKKAILHYKTFKFPFVKMEIDILNEFKGYCGMWHLKGKKNQID